MLAYLLDTIYFWAEHTITFREEIREILSRLLAVDCLWSQGQLKLAIAKRGLGWCFREGRIRNQYLLAPAPSMTMLLRL
jgi:hypothetical protein